MKEDEISSAEMTAYWRTEFPKYSGDTLSVLLASHAGIAKAKKFEEEYEYGLIGRKISVRAGFFLNKSLELLRSGQYDTCVSCGSGLSLLTYFIASKLSPIERNKIQFIDCDLSIMLENREQRYAKLPRQEIDLDVLENIKSKPLNFEEVYQHQESLQEIVGNNKKPLFIMEGLSYFLSHTSLWWLIEYIRQYESAAIIIDYWPEENIIKSEVFRRVMDVLNEAIPETVKNFWSHDDEHKIKSMFSYVEISDIDTIEHEMAMSLHEKPLLIDPNHYFPVKLIVAQKNR